MKRRETLKTIKRPLNESPSEKEGKSSFHAGCRVGNQPSMKVPPKRKGNKLPRVRNSPQEMPSMKVPPKRKGNTGRR